MKTRFSRTILMVAGICTVIVVLLSQSFYQPADKQISRSANEKNKPQPTEKHVSVAPDVVPTPAVQLDKNTPSLLKIFAPAEHSGKSFFPDSRIFVSFFKALLRATISPNAP